MGNRIKAVNQIKKTGHHNPLITQSFCADPYAMEYDGRVYIYMTGDEPMFAEDGSIVQNNYSNINTLRVISSDDLVNWTDHGAVNAAGPDGAANWGNNSWAPAACWKIIDGKPKFFLYFANSGNGIAVLSADSPLGPFSDPLGHALISRDTPTCDLVTWLFDPAVLVDSDGCGYIYFGGGVPGDDKISNPGTARVAKLTDDMIHLDGDPIAIENVLYLFEDSGINKIGKNYIYSYCSNFDVPDGGCEGYGFGRGEIITMVSDSPMGPFKTVRSILKNPEYFFEYGGNNHHCMFTFKDKWYVTYHASLVEEAQGECHGYRSVNIDEIEVDEEGLFKVATGTKEGAAQLKLQNPYTDMPFAVMSNQGGIKVTPKIADVPALYGDMDVEVTKEGAFICVSGLDFSKHSDKCSIILKSDNPGCINIRVDDLDGENIGEMNYEPTSELCSMDVMLTNDIQGVHDLYFVFDAVGTRLVSWSFK